MEHTLKIVGESPAIQEALRAADLVAATNVPVLINGGNGTGKDLFAHYVHLQSKRKNRSFITINCTAISSHLIEPLLFGKNGYLQKAFHGTLLIKEISELPIKLQSKLQFFLETNEVIDPDSGYTKMYDVRVIASTSKDLRKEMAIGRFKPDLFYQLNNITLELPSLEARKEDVFLLMDFFNRRLVKKKHQPSPDYTKEALKHLSAYHWPGNVRELQNFCERMSILFSGEKVKATHLPSEVIKYSQNKISTFFLPATGIKLEQVEVDLIQQALQNSMGNKSHAARLLGLTRDTFLYRLKKYSIDY